jgi:hypothetical protein
VTSARNRPTALTSSVRHRTVSPDAEVAQSTGIVEAGMDPDAVADLVVDGVRTKRFYVLTEPALFEHAVTERTRRILSGEPPTAMSVAEMLRRR